MKNKTFHKKQNQVSKTLMVAIAVFTLFLAGCFDFDFVNQPYTADPNSSFSVEISVSVNGGSGIPYFGVLLPIGWTVDEPIQFIKEIYADTGFVYYSNSLSQQMTNIDPAPENYYWWVASNSNYLIEGTYFINFNIYTDNQNGDFFLDYMLGSEHEGLNYSRSNGHIVIIGEAEGCAPEGVVISCQEDVDNFQTNYPDCSVMAGDITISGDSISNLNGLSVVTDISGSLRIMDNTALTNLTGLENLASIGCNLTIVGNQSLNDIQGLNMLTSIERDLIIENNPALTQISGLNSLPTIGRDLGIKQNSVLVGLSGMDNLTSIGGCLYVYENYALTSLTGIENVTSIGGNLDVGYNDALISLLGLENITSIGGDLIIDGSNGLISLIGLENVTSIGGDLDLIFNQNLISLTGLDNLTSIGGNLIIESNYQLCNCEIDAICAYLTNPNGAIFISSNANGCSSIIELVLACGTTMPCFYEEGIELYSQFDVDHFPAVFPGCSNFVCNFYIGGNDIVSLDSLGVITSIGGDLFVEGNNTLTSLRGLDNLTSIGGDLSVDNNDSLTSLAGLDNVASIGGDLFVDDNDALTSLAGLDNVTSTGGNLNIGSSYYSGGNPNLTSLSGLEGLNSIGGYLRISSNNVLTNLTGLDNMTSIGGDLKISGNDVLTSLTGLDNLTSIGSSFSIHDNDALISLTGLDNVVPGSIENLSVHSNSTLRNCAIESICEYLAAPNGTIEIHNNAPGCSSQQEVEDACMGYCLSHGITFSTQAQIDNFQTNYPDCPEIEGSVSINGSNITNLNGLSVLNSIGGDLSFANNATLTNLTGLDNLTSIGGDLYVGYNDALTSFTGLDSLASIGGDLYVRYNDTLTSLTGLENVAPGSVENLIVKFNNTLSNCAVESICAYLADPNGTVEIHGNAPGCNSPEEVMNICIQGVEKEEILNEDNVKIYPSPVNDFASLQFQSDQPCIGLVEIFNATGVRVQLRQINTDKPGQQHLILDFTALPAGIYFCRVQAGGEMFVKKFIKN